MGDFNSEISTSLSSKLKDRKNKATDIHRERERERESET